MADEGSGGRYKKHKAICKKCEFKGYVNEEELCRNCEEEEGARKEICSVCTKRVRKNERGLQCDSCQVWHHVKCEKVEDEVYEVLKKQQGTLWFCTPCNPKVRANLREASKIIEENKMKKELHVLKEKNELMVKKMEEIEEKWKERESKIEEEKGDLKAELIKWKRMNEELKESFDSFEEKMRAKEEEMVRRVTERVFENMEERDEREKRKRNVIMFNVKESSKEDVKEREKEDIEMCEHVFRDKLGVEGAQVEKAYRLGKRERGKERPLVACLSDVYAKWGVVKRSKELRYVQEEEIRNIRIGVDKTKKEREEEALLREELQEKRREGGQWIIKKGKVVRVSEHQGRD